MKYSYFRWSTTHRQIVLFGIIFILAACSLPVSLDITGAQGQPAISYNLATQATFPTNTPTPFLPSNPTPTYIPTEYPTPTPLPPTPVVTRQVELPPGLDVPMPKGQLNILLLGSDQRRGDPGFRTDVIMLVSLNPRKGAASIVSFPRDLFVNIPGYGMNRINTAQFWGFGTTQGTFSYNFGVNVDHYILTDFSSFVEIINLIGGIDVNVEKNLSDKCPFTKGINGYCYVEPGNNHMTGEFALWYVRSRYSSSDFDRTRRVQEVIVAVFRKLMTKDALGRIPQLFKKMRQSVETDMDFKEFLSLAPMAPTLFNNPEKIRRYAIGPGEVWPYTTEAGVQVLLPNQAAINQILSEAVFNR